MAAGSGADPTFCPSSRVSRATSALSALGSFASASAAAAPMMVRSFSTSTGAVRTSISASDPVGVAELSKVVIRGNSTRSKNLASPEHTHPVPVCRLESWPLISSAMDFSTLALSQSTTGFWSAGAVSRWATTVSQLPSMALCSAWVRCVARMSRMPSDRPAVASSFA